MPDDYSVHLITARKALQNAEEWAAIHEWTKAYDCAYTARAACRELEGALAMMIDRKIRSRAEG